MQDDSAFERAPTRPLPDDGYRLWLRYDSIDDARALAKYRSIIKSCSVRGGSKLVEVARAELELGLCGLLNAPIGRSDHAAAGSVLAGTLECLPEVRGLGLEARLAHLGSEGFVIIGPEQNALGCALIVANDARGVLYGAFHFLRLLQTGTDLGALNLQSKPRLTHRILDHWDNLSGTVERGYAGSSLWDWHKLPDYVCPRYRDYARANASLGINGVVLTNVNANSRVLTAAYLEKVAALAELFRAHGIRVYLTARFSAPMELGGLSTADPLDDSVREFWRDTARRIYEMIPDFGGFLVKADSEGQPGPHQYGRTHAEGANVFADALSEWGGAVFWRAFVYAADAPEDRAKQAFQEFVPLDGKFRENVFLQVKNGPIDFQPREPFHPLFGAMPRTPLMLEFQLTQEYLGCATHLVYLGPLFKECLESDTYAEGAGSTVAKVVEGSLSDGARGGIAGVANIGTDRNWCGHPFAQANWYAFGRLAWDHELDAAAIAREWIGMTFGPDPLLLDTLAPMMLQSREAAVDYMTPLGLHHIMARDHHYGPGPWVEGGRADWTSLYYHRADSTGIGFDRTSTGSGALDQYSLRIREQFGTPERCPERFLLWFHHVPWTFSMKSGRSLWDELCCRYQGGVDAVRRMQECWASLEPRIDPARFDHVSSLLRIQEKEARWWRDACVLYFQTFSSRSIPDCCETPEHSLAYYRGVDHHYVPGTPTRF